MRAWCVTALVLASRLGAQPGAPSLTNADLALAERITMRSRATGCITHPDAGWGSACPMSLFVIHRDGLVERSKWMAAEFDYLIAIDTIRASRASIDSLITVLAATGYPRIPRPTCTSWMTDVGTIMLSVVAGAKRASVALDVSCSERAAAVRALGGELSRVTASSRWHPAPPRRATMSVTMASAGCYQLTFGRPRDGLERADLPFEVELGLAPAAVPLQGLQGTAFNRMPGTGRYAGPLAWRATSDTLHLMWISAGRTITAPLVRRNGIHEGVASLSVEGRGVVASTSLIATRVKCWD